VKEVYCTVADSLGMVTIDLSGFRGSSPTRGRTLFWWGGSVSSNCSMDPQLGTPWRCARSLLHRAGCPEDGHHRLLWLSWVVANSRTHPGLVVWFCIAQLVGGHPVRETMA